MKAPQKPGRGGWSRLLPLTLTLCAAAASGCASSGPAASPSAATSAAVSTPPAEAVEGEMVRVEPHGEWAEAVLYFAIVDRFADGDASNNRRVDPQAAGTFHGGDLVGLRRNLDELSSLGATALWITPVVANIPGFVTGAGFPDWGYHGYWADDFERLDPRFGSEEDLRELVDAAHERGIAVLLDVVYNHAGYGSALLDSSSTRRWFRTDGECGNDDLTQCLSGLPDFRTELPVVADYLFEAHLGLAERTGLDGFRLDTVKHVEAAFWGEHRRRSRDRLGEDFFLLGEVWGGSGEVLDPYFERDDLDAGFDFTFQGSVLAFLQGRGRAVAFDRFLERRENVREGYHLAHFLSSHDVPGALYQLEGDKARFRLAAFLQMTNRGIPVIYYGEEVGRLGGDWPENRSHMPWGERDIAPGSGVERDEDMRRDYQRLIALRRALPALWRGRHQSVYSEGDVLAFLRHADDDDGDDASVLVMVNRSESPQTVRFELPEDWRPERLEDHWRGLPLHLDGATLEVALPALEGVIASASNLSITAAVASPANQPSGGN